MPASVRYTALLDAHSRRWRALAKAGTLVDGITAAFQVDLAKKATGESPSVQPQQVTHALAAFPADVETALNLGFPRSRGSPS